MAGSWRRDRVRPTVTTRDADQATALARARWQDALSAFDRAAHAVWDAARETREKDGPLLFMVGDSIVQGHAFGTFAFDPQREWSVFQHPDRLFCRLAADAGSPWRAAFGGVFSPAQLPKAIGRTLRPGDVVLYQDWGWRPAGYDAALWAFAAIAGLTAEFPGVRCALMTGHARPGTPAAFDPDAPCADTPLTANDAARAAAGRTGAEVLDAAAVLPVAEAAMAATLGGSLYGADGVHLNVYGNLFLAGWLLRRMDGGPVSLGAVQAPLAACPHAPLPAAPSLRFLERLIAEAG